jgi:hypothetical protein
VGGRLRVGRLGSGRMFVSVGGIGSGFMAMGMVGGVEIVD